MAQRLDPRHDLALLRRKGDAERLRPLDMVGHHLDELREGDERLDARIPWQRLKRGDQRVALQRRVALVLEPSRGIDNLLRVGRRHQHLGDELIGIERNRRHHLVDLLAGVLGDRFRRLRERGLRLTAARRGLRHHQTRRDQQKRQHLRHQSQLERVHLHHPSV